MRPRASVQKKADPLQIVEQWAELADDSVLLGLQ
jgi:hypothetical protein